MATEKRIIFAILAALGVALVLMQFWPVERTNPPVQSIPQWDSEETRALAERACFDCHSNETVWPWYTALVPVQNLMVRDVEEGRRVLNFSEWEATCCTEDQIDEMAAIINQEQMPLPYYVRLHPEAQLSDGEKGQLANGLIATMARVVEGN